MKLFVKIFLWFLFAIALMVGVVILLNWTVQTEPVVSRWRVSVRNQTSIYAETAAQIYERQGEAGLNEFLERIRKPETIVEVDIIGENGKVWTAPGVTADTYRELVAKALASDVVEIEGGQADTALSAYKFVLSNGERFVLVMSWERPRFTPFFGETPLFRYIRYGFLLLTAVLLCWALARYLSSPIGKLRKATQKLADGDLQTRVATGIGRRRDELADLARDFDVMAERIESLITSQQRLSRDISHELRSPLARLNVALEIAKQKSNAETAPMLDRMEIESTRLNDMISRLLTLAKLESGAEEVEPVRIDLAELVKDVAADADFEARAKGRSVEVSSADACNVPGSENLLRSAIENVLRNAVRYTAEGTQVDVSLAATNGVAIIRVSDQGGGVPDEELANLFRPFYRVGEDRTRKTGGIGLGLAIAERAVKAHKGTISAKNAAGGLLIEITLGTGHPVSF
jgi:two-component system sensor histidine kinase CpxA